MFGSRGYYGRLMENIDSSNAKPIGYRMIERKRKRKREEGMRDGKIEKGREREREREREL